ncbi:MAG: hypothetical protein J2P36_35320, partial [Ktedonobacteraceae bacterium]|nr:hypothetical protein [Ktedonobacteraceae bacterium]
HNETDGLVARDDIVQPLKQRLTSGKGHTLTALYGLPGVGKSAIAVELAHDEDIQQHFRDGILWATPGIRHQNTSMPDTLGRLTWSDEG